MQAQAWPNTTASARAHGTTRVRTADKPCGERPEALLEKAFPTVIRILCKANPDGFISSQGPQYFMPLPLATAKVGAEEQAAKSMPEASGFDGMVTPSLNTQSPGRRTAASRIQRARTGSWRFSATVRPAG